MSDVETDISGSESGSESGAGVSKKFNWWIIPKVALGVLISVMILCYISGGMLIHDSKFANQALLCPTLFTDTYDVSIPGIKRQSLVIPTADGQKLDAWLFVVPGATKLTIVNHGNAGNLTSRGIYAQAFTTARTNVLLYDYRGYGKSTGAATVHGILEDGQTVYQYVRNKLGYPAGKIIEFGESIGTAVACQTAADAAGKDNCCALMLYAPIDSVPRAARWKLPFLQIYPDFCFAEQLNNLALIAKVHGPVFICHGKKDSTLCSDGSQSLYNAANQPKKLVFLPDSGHYDMTAADGKLYIKSLTEFVAALP